MSANMWWFLLFLLLGVASSHHPSPLPNTSRILQNHTKSNSSSPRVIDIHVSLCGGIFNNHVSLSAAVWLVFRAQSLVRSGVRLQLRIPAMDMSHLLRNGSVIPFSKFYDVEQVRQLTKRMHVLDEVKKCPHLLPLDYQFNERSPGTPLQLARIMDFWPHDCVFIYNGVTKNDPFAPRCAWHLRTPWAQMNETGQAHFIRQIRFHPRFYAIAAQALSRLPSPFFALRLRIEAEAIWVFYQKHLWFSGPNMTKCLREHGWFQPQNGRHNQTIYLSAGRSIYHYPEVQHWLQTPGNVTFLNISDLLPDSILRTLGREEFGIIEALICENAVSFAGVSYSTRSLYVMLKQNQDISAYGSLQAMPNDGKPTFFWNQQCPNVLVRVENETVARQRLFEERAYLAHHH